MHTSDKLYTSYAHEHTLLIPDMDRCMVGNDLLPCRKYQQYTYDENSVHLLKSLIVGRVLKVVGI